jgi:hypothetical protein
MNATLLYVALLVPGYGEWDILKGIMDAGGEVDFGGAVVKMPRSTTDANLGELCELRDLYNLGLKGTSVTDKGMRTVAALRQLYSLDLARTGITDVGLRRLERLSKLSYLDLHNCPNITDAGVARLQKALPKCKIYH